LKQAEADRTALDKLNAELVQDKAIAEEMARKDPLTGLGNRRTFFSAVSTIDQQAKQSGRTYSIVLIDLDYFKAINDTHGHPVGDEVLKWVARTIQEAVRRSDIPTRIGGEEFGVLMPGTHLGDAANLAERLRKAIADTVLPGHGKSIQVTASIGVTEYGENDETYKQTIQRADEALYLAKGEGRNRVVIKPLA
jgi:diguanylate cyclase (GGDEF)-like protein